MNHQIPTQMPHEVTIIMTIVSQYQHLKTKRKIDIGYYLQGFHKLAHLPTNAKEKLWHAKYELFYDCEAWGDVCPFDRLCKVTYQKEIWSLHCTVHEKVLKKISLQYGAQFNNIFISTTMNG